MAIDEGIVGENQTQGPSLASATSVLITELQQLVFYTYYMWLISKGP